MENIFIKIKERNLRLPFGLKGRVLVIGMVLSVAIFLFLISFFREYKTTLEILIIPRSESTVLQTEDVVQNVIDFSQTLSFYDRLLKFNPQIKDSVAEKNSGERKNFWNKQLEVSRKHFASGTIIELGVFAKNSAQSEILAQKIATNLFEVTSQAYDVKNDLGIMIIDGPLTGLVLKNSFSWAFLSILIGFLLAVILNFIFDQKEKIKVLQKSRFTKSPLADLKERFGQKKMTPSTETETIEKSIDDFPLKEALTLEEEKVFFDEKTLSSDFSEIVSNHAKDFSVPANLPVADETIFFGKSIESELTEKQSPNFVEMKKNEPTEEELKSRLNNLLKGGL